MAFKDEGCTCEDQCTCGVYDPCGCESMGIDPHCMTCCGHLNPEHEARWREEEGKWYCQPWIA